MANIKQTKEDALAIIDAALAILQKFPDLDETNTTLSFNTSLNPFSFLLDLFKSTAGYNYVIEILARFIAYELPAVEAAIKALLISQLKSILSCSVNPLLTEEILREGIVFNIDEIDLADILKYSPFDQKVGKYFYFGTEGIGVVDDLVYCNDMDAFIWFMINRANRRYVWKPLTYRGQKFYEPNSEHIKRKEDYNKKTIKADGILTFEFYEKATNARDAYGGDYQMQTPYNNCLHVFIGDVREDQAKINELITAEDELSTVEKEINKTNEDIENKELKKDELENEKNKLDEQLSNEEIDKDTYKKNYESYIEQLNNINKELNKLNGDLDTKQHRKGSLQYKIGNIDLKAMGENIYSMFSGRNYYTGHPLLEFNIDYVMSLRFFEERVLAARLIESLTGILTIDLGLTYKQQFIKNEVKNMVSMIVESDDVTISDCFFTFSNDQFDAMSRQAELRKAGLLSIDGNENGAVKLDAANILENINGITEGASKETIQTIIKGALTDISGQITQTDYEEKDSINFGLQVNFIENLLNSLAYALVSAVLSPKVYLLILINLKIMGKETNFSLEQFIGSFKDLIATLIRAIRDMLLEYLVNELMKIVGNLVKEVANKLMIEQAQYYARLIKKLIDCFRRHGSTLDFTMDRIEHADILPDDSEPANSEC